MRAADVEVGTELPEQRVVADIESMKIFTLIMADPNPIHFDREGTAAAGLGSRLINQGTLNMAYPVNVLARWVGDAACIRSFRCRFLGSVHENDDVIARASVVAVEGNQVTLSISLEQSGGQQVLTGTAVVEL